MPWAGRWVYLQGWEHAQPAHFLQVLCASTAEAVEPLAVPEGVPNGEPISVEGYPGEPEPQLNPKKKVLESLLPDMATDASASSL